MFLLFVIHGYYPDGGWDDMIATCDSIEEAEIVMSGYTADWAHVIDLSGGPRNARRHNYKCKNQYSEDKEWYKV